MRSEPNMRMPYGPGWEDPDWSPHAAPPDESAAMKRDAHPIDERPVVGSLAQFMEVVKRFATKPLDAKLDFRNAKPVIRRDRAGRTVNSKQLAQRVIAALRANTRLPVRVRTRTLPATVTAASFGKVIVINRSANRLYLFDGGKLARTFQVATGQAIYPTPKGDFHIVVKWMNPTWYPPVNDSWAKGLKPVPPGPLNPLGTRWMGLSSPGIGIHGTDEPTSIGYSASHGCIRMQVPDAEWLFDHVDVGTTVHIV